MNRQISTALATFCFLAATATRVKAVLYDVSSSTYHFSGDGSDYSPAVKRAIAAAASAGGGTIYFPSGTAYTLNEAITPSYCLGTTRFSVSLAFRGDSESGSIINASNSGSGSPLFDMEMSDNIYLVSFSNLTIRANSSGNGTAIFVSNPTSGNTLPYNNGWQAFVADTIQIGKTSGCCFNKGISVGAANNSVINNCDFEGSAGTGTAVSIDSASSTNMYIINSTMNEWLYGVDHTAAPFGQQGTFVNSCTISNVLTGIRSDLLSTTAFEWPSNNYVGNCLIEPYASPSSTIGSSGISICDSWWSCFDNNDIYLASSSNAGYGIWLCAAKQASLVQNFIGPYSGTVSNSSGIVFCISGNAYASTYLSTIQGNEIGNICSGSYPILLQSITYSQYEEYLYAFTVPTLNMIVGNYLPSGTSVYDSNTYDTSH